MFKNPENVKDIYDESDWSDAEACSTYEKSKLYAEKASWDYIKSLPEEERFEYVSLNPVIILGPNLIESGFTSGMIIEKTMSGAFPGTPKVMIPFVDVRNVA
jgi:nucleoside-diphosphate-sugar epimerase